jgi:ribosomal protein L11 methyltransferase
VIRLAVRCRPEDAERVLAELVELVPEGVEEQRGRTFVEYAIYGPPGELPEMPQLQAAAGEGLVEIETTEIPDDWADAWKDFHKPVRVGDRLVVRPSWARSDAEDRAGAPVEVVIDPGRAFGTGAHHTTRMCLELLLELDRNGEASGPLVDWGTGSGVLAIAAAKLGFDPVAGCDSERASLAAAGENAALNGVRLTLARVNLREDPAPLASTVVANLTASVLLAVADRLGEAPSTLACSGTLESEAAAVAAAFGALGLDEARRLRSGGWVAQLFRAA